MQPKCFSTIVRAIASFKILTKVKIKDYETHSKLSDA